MSEEPRPDEPDWTAAVKGVDELIALMNTAAVTRIRLRLGSLDVEVERAASESTVAAPPPQPEPAAEAESEPGTVITAPLVGVFYRRPAPGEPPFVEVGQRVEAGQQVAIVEAMKFMNPIISEHDGVVAAIHADEYEVVEFEQSLLSITPSR